MRYSLLSHGSGSKLSSLSEQVEREDTQRQRGGGGRGRGGEERRKRGSQRGKKSKGEAPLLTTEKQPKRHVFMDHLITTSQVLRSDEEEEIEEDNVDFTISLSLNSSHSSNKTDEQEEEEEEEEEGGSSEVATPKFTAAGRRCRSAGGRGSFSRQHSDQLTENFQQICSRAASLSSHQSWLEGSGDSGLLAVTGYHFEVSPATEIKPVTPTFQLPQTSHVPPSLSQSDCPPGDIPRNRNIDSSHLEGRGEGRGGVVVGEGVRVCLAPLQQAVTLAGELAAMAQARQGPIMLLSTDLVSLALCTEGTVGLLKVSLIPSKPSVTLFLEMLSTVHHTPNILLHIHHIHTTLHSSSV